MINENPSPGSPGTPKPFVSLVPVLFIMAASASADPLHHAAASRRSRPWRRPGTPPARRTGCSGGGRGRRLARGRSRRGWM